eukprot:Skav226722  [mRNA]  locus=scaffold3813:52439:55044:- [translate_table: standard]
MAPAVSGAQPEVFLSRVFAIGPPAAPAAEEEEEESEEDSEEDEDDAEAEVVMFWTHPIRSLQHGAMEVNHDYALWQTLGHWPVYVEWFLALLVAAAATRW